MPSHQARAITHSMFVFVVNVVKTPSLRQQCISGIPDICATDLKSLKKCEKYIYSQAMSNCTEVRKRLPLKKQRSSHELGVMPP